MGAVAPGEVFSFNGRVGYTDKAHGYKPAGVYTPNGLEDGYGGGVCQSIYNNLCSGSTG